MHKVILYLSLSTMAQRYRARLQIKTYTFQTAKSTASHSVTVLLDWTSCYPLHRCKVEPRASLHKVATTNLPSPAAGRNQIPIFQLASSHLTRDIQYSVITPRRQASIN